MNRRKVSALWAWLTALVLLPWPASALPLELAADIRHASAEGRLEHFADPNGELSFETARRHDFIMLPDYRSLGYDTEVHWFRFALHRTPDASSHWILAVGRPYLEEVDVWLEQPSGEFRQYALGKYRSNVNRPLPSNLFAIPFDIENTLNVYLRVRSNNPMIVNAEVWQPDAFAGDERRGTLYVGLHFGILLIAMALYAILGGWLRDAVMANYAGYIASQALMIHGDLLGLFTGDAPWIDDVLTRIGWLGSSVFIVLMWDKLLALKRYYPRIHRLYLFTIALDLALLPLALMPSKVNALVLVAVKLANILNSLNFFISMAVVLLGWWRSRRVELLLYFVAFLIPALGTLINTAASQGALAQNALTANIYQTAPLVHVLVMSFGLALRFRQVQHDKAAAEQEAGLATQRADEQRRFVAMLSHEFRNPLAAIDRSAQMILFKAPDLPAPELQRLSQIRCNVAALSGLVDNFLLTEALDHGAPALSRESCAIRPMLENVLQTLREESGQRIALSVTPPDAVFELDPTLLGMALGNLLGNALRYSPADSTVDVSACVEDRTMSICVADRGPGMSEEELAILGRPYFRANSSLGKQGSGLGYHFTRRIVEAHGGNLKAISRAGGGLVVKMLLCLDAGTGE